MDFGAIYIESIVTDKTGTKLGELSLQSNETIKNDGFMLTITTSSVDISPPFVPCDKGKLAPSPKLAPCDKAEGERLTVGIITNSIPSYWISINFIFGSLLYLTGSLFWTFDHYLTENDYFTLVTVAYFVGCLSLAIAYYINYYGIINGADDIKGHVKRRIFCCHSGKKSTQYYIALIFLISSFCYGSNALCNVLGIHFERGSLRWIIRMILYVIGGSCVWFGGVLDIYSNLSNASKSTLSWIISYSNCFGGFCFFVGSIGLFFESQIIIFWMAELPYIIGSGLYLFTSIISLYLWNKQNGDIKFSNVIFLCLYTITLAVAVTALIYASLCAKYIDWTKNFALGIMVTVGVLAFGSFMHQEQDRKSFKFIRLFSRSFMVFLTMNLMIDTYRLSHMVAGYECEIYENHGEFGAH